MKILVVAFCVYIIAPLPVVNVAPVLNIPHKVDDDEEYNDGIDETVPEAVPSNIVSVPEKVTVGVTLIATESGITIVASVVV